MPLDETGYTVLRHTDLVAEFDAKFLADEGLVLDSSNPDNATKLLQRLVNYMADIAANLSSDLRSIYDATNPDAAQGIQASNLARINGVTRKQGTPSTVTMRLTGTDGAVVSSGATRVRGGTSDPDTVWLATSDGTVAGGTVDVIFQATEPGPRTAAANSITSLVTPISGITSVTNPAEAAIGTDDETDGELLTRRKASVAARAGSGVAGVRNNVLALEFVQTALVLANGDSEARTKSGILLPGNSYLVVVMPTVLTVAQQQEILEVLYDSTLSTAQPVATAVSGEVLELNDGTSWPVAFDYGTELTVSLAFTTTLLTGADETEARTALAAACRALLPLTLGEELLQLQLCALASATGLIRTADVLIQGVDADFVPTAVQRISTFTITVNGVAA